MRGVFLVLLQIVISLLVVGAIMPAVLFAVAPARDPTMGLALTVAIILVVFILLRVVWPRPRRG